MHLSQLSSRVYHFQPIFWSVNIPVCVIFTGGLIKIGTMITYNYVSIKILKIKTQLGAPLFRMVYTLCLGALLWVWSLPALGMSQGLSHTMPSPHTVSLFRAGKHLISPALGSPNIGPWVAFIRTHACVHILYAFMPQWQSWAVATGAVWVGGLKQLLSGSLHKLCQSLVQHTGHMQRYGVFKGINV